MHQKSQCNLIVCPPWWCVAARWCHTTSDAKTTCRTTSICAALLLFTSIWHLHVLHCRCHGNTNGCRMLVTCPNLLQQRGTSLVSCAAELAMHHHVLKVPTGPSEHRSDVLSDLGERRALQWGKGKDKGSMIACTGCRGWEQSILEF
jgi:hypothetical protein